MSHAGVSIGIMDKAYFVGRKEVLRWLNDLLDTDYKKVEQTCNGAAACQVLDVMFKGKVPMSKVNWGARSDYEYVKNYKVLQGVFNKLKIQKHVEVEKLIRGKYQDNLEWMQWLKSFCESNTGEDVIEAYNPRARRTKSKGAKSAPTRSGPPGERPSRSSARDEKPARAEKPAKAKVSARRKATKVQSDEKENRRAASGSSRDGNRSRRTAAARPSSAVVDGLKKRVKELEDTNAELKLMTDGLEKERDFYFNKLRDVELMLQEQTQEGADGEAQITCTGKELSDQIFKILYATEDDPDAEAAEPVVDTMAAEAPTVEAGTEEMLF